MKRTLALFLDLLMLLSLAACGGGNDATSEEMKTEPEVMIYQVGDTIAGETIEITLTRAEFTEAVNGFADTADFLLPIDIESIDESAEKGFIKADEDNILLSYSFSFKYVGKKEQTLSGIGKPYVTYDDEYSFSSNYIVATGKDTSWLVLDTDLNNVSLIYSNNKYKPLDSTTYECRGYIVLPLEVAKTEKTLILNLGFADGDFTIR